MGADSGRRLGSIICNKHDCFHKVNLTSNPTLPPRGSLSLSRHGIFLLHTLPDGFHRIRHYGFLANGCRPTRHHPATPVAMKLALTTAAGETTRPLPRFDPTVCPCWRHSAHHRRDGALGRHDRSRIPHDDRMSPQHRSWQYRGISVDGRNDHVTTQTAILVLDEADTQTAFDGRRWTIDFDEGAKSPRQ